ncbi:MAG: hypothetical protein C4519_19840 [Desulfobacteraceae bacterium]|nr:MAG: hypothetical protein C4519_19840 [Desulfobacteraceae bacterium]
MSKLAVVRQGSNDFIYQCVLQGIDPCLGAVQLVRDAAESEDFDRLHCIQVMHLIEDRLIELRGKLMELDGARFQWPG